MLELIYNLKFILEYKFNFHILNLRPKKINKSKLFGNPFQDYCHIYMDTLYILLTLTAWVFNQQNLVSLTGTVPRRAVISN